MPCDLAAITILLMRSSTHFRQKSADLAFQTKCTKIVLKPNTLIKELFTAVIESVQIQLPVNAAGQLAFRERVKGKLARRKEALLYLRAPIITIIVNCSYLSLTGNCKLNFFKMDEKC